jgi:hypothetical protein
MSGDAVEVVFYLTLPVASVYIAAADGDNYDDDGNSNSNSNSNNNNNNNSNNNNNNNIQHTQFLLLKYSLPQQWHQANQHSPWSLLSLL